MKTATLDECKEILNYYICTNGAKLGSLFFKAHIKEENIKLPDSIKNIDTFLEENVKSIKCETKNLNKEVDLNMLKFDLLKIKLLNNQNSPNPRINEIIDKWVKNIGS